MDTTLSRRGLFRAFVAEPAAAKPSSESPSRLARIGDGCVERAGVTCRRCGEVCEGNAIRFRPLGGGRAEARLDDSLCTGCGECLPLCPVSAIALVARERAALMSALVKPELTA